MRRGICCIVLSLQDREPSLKFKTMTYKKFSSMQRKDGLQELGKRIHNNMMVTAEAIRFCHDKGYTYRLSSDLFPLITYDKAKVRLEDLPNYKQISDTILDTRDYLREHPVRLSSHPSEFNVLATENKDALHRTVNELNFTGWFLTQLGCPLDYNSPINIHINNSRGNFDDIAKRFTDNLGLLTDDARKRLVVENDDKSKCWSVRKLTRHLYPVSLVPLTFDYLHHKCHPDDFIEKDAFSLCYDSWRGYRPLFHYSESREGKNPRAHADYVKNFPDTYGFEDIDVDFEFKMKDKAFNHVPAN